MILHEELSSSEREPVRLRPFPSVPGTESPSVAPLTPVPSVSSESFGERASLTTEPAQSPSLPPSSSERADAANDRESPPVPQVAPLPVQPEVQRPTEYLIDQMDVYALSPHAVRLALPRMVPPSLISRWQEEQAMLPGAARWEAIIHKASLAHGLPPALIAAVIKVESNFDPSALSPKGAQGLLQLMPETQQELGVVDAFDPESNVMAGCTYLRQQLEKFGSLELALAAYNAGPGNVTRYGGIPPFAETQSFVKKVLGHLNAAQNTPR